MSDRGSLPESFDPRTPTNARLYDYALGGKDNFAADRAVADRMRAEVPNKSQPTTENRKFMRRAVRFLLDQGIRQFLDIGCGIPGRGNVHDLAHQVDPAAGVVYVDYDPIAVTHYAAVLPSGGNAAAVHADTRRPGTVLTHPDVTRLIDFDRPVGLLMMMVLDMITDAEDPAGIVARYRGALAPGSFLALSHSTFTGKDRRQMELGAAILESAREVWRPRGRRHVTSLFDGFELLEPGVVAAPDWRPDRPYTTPSGWMLAGVGRLGSAA
jgi:S-adenosyl methyltransferase